MQFKITDKTDTNEIAVQMAECIMKSLVISLNELKDKNKESFNATLDVTVNIKDSEI